MAIKQRNIYVLTRDNDMDAHKSLRCLVEHYPNIPYYKLYRAIKDKEIAYIKDYKVRKIVMYG